MKIGPGAELEVAVALVPDRRAGHVGRQQVGRELDAAEAEPARLGEGARGQRLREPRHVLEQDVAVGEQAEQDQLELLALADDGALDLVDEAGAELCELAELHQIALQRRHDAAELCLVDPGAVTLGRLRPIGPDELPDVVAERGVRAVGIALEVDAAARGEQLRGELRDHGAKAKVDVERRRARHRHLALEPARASPGARQPAAVGGGSRRTGTASRG